MQLQYVFSLCTQEMNSYISMASKHIHFPIQNEYNRTLCPFLLRTCAGVAKVQRYREERLRVGIYSYGYNYRPVNHTYSRGLRAPRSRREDRCMGDQPASYSQLSHGLLLHTALFDQPMHTCYDIVHTWRISVY